MCCCYLLYVIQCSIQCVLFFFFFSSRRRHTRCSRDWSSDVCSSDLSLSGAFGPSAIAYPTPPYLVGTDNDGTGNLSALDLMEVGLYPIGVYPRVQIGRASCRERV